MITLLICEDEAFERQALCDLIKLHFADELTVIGEAENGRRAIELAERYRPEIVIMDIQMPVYDGLTASRRIRKLLPDTEIVISTAYGQFNFARRAIVIGVFDYMVKPVTPSEFIEVMHRLIEKVLKKRSRLEISNREITIGKLARDLVEQELLLKSMRGGDPSQTDLSRLVSLLDLAGCSYGAALYRIHTAFDSRAHDIESLTVCLQHHFSYVIIIVLVDEIAALLFDPKGHNATEALRNEITRDFIPDFIGSQGYSQLSQAPSGINEVFQHARIDLNTVLTRAEDRTDNSRYIIELENQLCDRLVCEEAGEAEQIVERLAQAVLEQPDQDNWQEYGRSLFAWIHGYIDRFFDGGIESVNTSETRNRVNSISNPSDFILCFNSIIKKATALIAQQKRSANETLVSDLQAYIESHLDEQLTVASLTELATISTGHLRKLFREILGEGIKEYILNRKMQRAGELLRQKNLMIKEVAAATGFSDQNYFSRVFKDHFGVAPREYMNR